MWRLPVHVLSIVRERGATGGHAVGESVHVGPVLLVERGIVFDARGAGRGTAVDEEVDGVECTGDELVGRQPIRVLDWRP